MSESYFEDEENCVIDQRKKKKLIKDEAKNGEITCFIDAIIYKARKGILIQIFLDVDI